MKSLVLTLALVSIAASAMHTEPTTGQRITYWTVKGTGYGLAALLGSSVIAVPITIVALTAPVSAPAGAVAATAAFAALPSISTGVGVAGTLAVAADNKLDILAKMIARIK